MGRVSDLVMLARDTVYRLRTRGKGDFPTGRTLKPGVILELAVREARRIALRDRKTIVISLSKSGRTWLRVMLDQLGLHLEYQHPDGRVGLPPAWLGKKIIFLHRDPRDVLVSLWFHESRRVGVDCGSFSDFIADPRYGLEQIIRANLVWRSIVEASPEGLILTYEDLHRDTAGQLRRVLDFVARPPCSDRRLEQAVEHGRFERMREAELSGAGARLYGTALEPADPNDPDSFKTRRGETGAWKDCFTADDSKAAERMLREHDYFRLMAS